MGAGPTIHANFVLGVLVAFLLLFFASVTNFMKKADVYAKTGRSGDDEMRALELWMASLQTLVKAASKERVFELSRAFATGELAWAMELDSFSTRIIVTVAEGLGSVELKVTGTSRKKLHTIRQRPANMKRLAEVHKGTIGKGTLKRLRAKV